MGKSSSAKKAARVAKSSSGRKVRSQQGLVFPVALAVVLTLGLALVVYGRATNREDLGAPQLNTASEPGDHWHAAYGVYICDQYIPSMSVGVEPDPGGIHTHQDGVIHIHPFQTATTGRNARMSDFFGQTGLDVTSNKIQLPDDPALGDNSGQTFENGDECPDGQEGVVKVLVWEDAAGTSDPKVFIADIDRIRFTNNAMAFAFAFVPADQDVSTIPRPPTAAQLEELGALDSGSAATSDSGSSTTVDPTATTLAGTATTTAATATTTAPAATATTLAGG